MGPPRFERESEDPQSPRIPGYPTAPCSTYIGCHLFIKLRFCRLEKSRIFYFARGGSFTTAEKISAAAPIRRPTAFVIWNPYMNTA